MGVDLFLSGTASGIPCGAFRICTLLPTGYNEKTKLFLYLYTSDKPEVYFSTKAEKEI